MRFNEEGMVVQVRAYLDPTLVKQAIDENEEGTPVDQRASIKM